MERVIARFNPKSRLGSGFTHRNVKFTINGMIVTSH